LEKKLPWTEKQHKLFAFAATNPSKAKSEGIKIPQESALRMMKEGIKKDDKSKSAIRHLGRRKLA
jgi:hypothetical protein